MDAPEPATSFEALLLPHLDAAYNLAQWILREPGAAEDAVQDAMVHALTYFHTFRGQNARAWLLQIVRNAAYRQFRRRQDVAGLAREDAAGFDGEWASSAVRLDDPPNDHAGEPEQALIREQTRSGLAEALRGLPLELRECLVLRELEDLSYRDIAQITDVPIGTVMSRLWRARKSLLRLISAEDT